MKGKKIIFLGLIGLILRLVLMPFTFHPDLWAISFSEYLFAFKGVTNIYDYLANISRDSALIQNYGSNFFTYPPLAYYSFGIFGLTLRPFFNQDFFDNLTINLPTILNDGRLFWHLFLTKLPYLFFDFGILFLLVQLFEDKKKKFLAAILWLFNPLVFYTSYMIGQFDIIPVFFAVFSLYLAKKDKWEWAAFFLGVGGAYKMFPLFFLPLLAVAGGKDLMGKLKLFVFGLAPYLLTIMPFLGSASFRQNVLFSNQSQKMLFAKIPVSGAEYLSVFLVLYVFLILFSLVRKIDLWKWFFMTMLLFFSVTHYHPQWFLWLTPFLIIFWLEYPHLKFIPIVLLGCWFLIMIFFEPSLSIALFAPVFPQLTRIVPFSVALSRIYDIYQFRSLIRSIFAGTCLTASILLFKKDEIA